MASKKSDSQGELRLKDLELSSPARLQELAEWLRHQADMVLSGELDNNYRALFMYSGR